MEDTNFILAEQTSQDGSERIEVALISSGDAQLEIRLLNWGEGIGWYIQKRIALDAQEAHALRDGLGQGCALIQAFSKTSQVSCNPQALEDPDQHIVPLFANTEWKNTAS